MSDVAMLWSMETASDAPELFLAERGEGRPVRFQVISKDGGPLLKHCDALPDYLMWPKVRKEHVGHLPLPLHR